MMNPIETIIRSVPATKRADTLVELGMTKEPGKRMEYAQELVMLRDKLAERAANAIYAHALPVAAEFIQYAMACEEAAWRLTGKRACDE